jgi:hypothetical protein
MGYRARAYDFCFGRPLSDERIGKFPQLEKGLADMKQGQQSGSTNLLLFPSNEHPIERE